MRDRVRSPLRITLLAALVALLAAPAADARRSVGSSVVSIVPSANGTGYWLATDDGTLQAYGRAASLNAREPVQTLVGIAPAAGGRGVWLAGIDGRVSAVGRVPATPAAPGPRGVAGAVAIAGQPNGTGYRVLRADGLIESAGSARPLEAAPPGPRYSALAATSSGAGAWAVTSTGAVVPRGDAPALAPTQAVPPGEQVAGVARAPGGLWVAFASGRVIPYGSAPSLGSAPADRARVRSIAPTPSGRGYWLVREDGRVLGYGDAGRFAPATPDSIPAIYLPIYRAAAQGFGVSPYLLASIHLQETGFSRVRLPGVRSGRNRHGCCAGPMQFSIRRTATHRLGTWGQYRGAFRKIAPLRPVRYPLDGRALPACKATSPCVYDDFDALSAAASMLADLGASTALGSNRTSRALCRYGGVCPVAPRASSCRRPPSRVATARDYACIVLARAKRWRSDRRIPSLAPPAPAPPAPPRIPGAAAAP